MDLHTRIILTFSDSSFQFMSHLFAHPETMHIYLQIKSPIFQILNGLQTFFTVGNIIIIGLATFQLTEVT